MRKTIPTPLLYWASEHTIVEFKYITYNEGKNGGRRLEHKKSGFSWNHESRSSSVAFLWRIDQREFAILYRTTARSSWRISLAWIHSYDRPVGNHADVASANITSLLQFYVARHAAFYGQRVARLTRLPKRLPSLNGMEISAVRIFRVAENSLKTNANANLIGNCTE